MKILLVNLNTAIIAILTLLILSSCATQESAPIERNDNTIMDYRNVNGSTNNSYNRYTALETYEQDIKSKEIKVNKEEVSDFDNEIGDMTDGNNFVKQQQEHITWQETKTNALQLKNNEYGNKYNSFDEAEDVVSNNDSSADYEKINKYTNKQNNEHNNIKDQRVDSSSYILPIKNLKNRIVTGFNENTINGKSSGIDISANAGENVIAAGSARVVYSGKDEKFGNLVIIKLDDTDLYVAYAYIASSHLKKGDRVLKGDTIGYIANSSSPKLHLAMRKKTNAIDPMQYLK